MKGLLVIIFSVVLIQWAGAQQPHVSQIPGPPNMAFTIELSPVNSSSSNLDIGGWANYGRLDRYPDFGTDYQTFTNDLEVTIILPSKPDSAWLLEEKEDGSFKDVARMTNYINGDSVYIDQRFRLNKSQIHSLVKGDMYAEVDFSDSIYTGKLVPDYQLASGPAPVFDFLSPLFWHGSEYGYVVIAKDNQKADVIISGTQSIDPYYLPMEYTWTWNTYYLGPLSETNTSPKFSHHFGVGNYYIRLQARDVIATGGSPIINLAVYTPSQAINFFSPAIQNLPIPQKQIAVLNAQLSQAANDFDQGKLAKGRLELIAFIFQIKKADVSSPVVAYILNYSQKLLQSLDW